MTNKELVKEIMPTAYCYYLRSIGAFIIFGLREIYDRQDGDYADTEEDAWKSTLHRLQSHILQKLSY